MINSGDLSKDIQKLLTEQVTPTCIIGRIKLELSEQDANALNALIDSKVTVLQICNILRKHNFKVGNTAVAVHRRKQCICYRSL